MREKFRRIEEEMNALFFERKDEIRGLLVGLLSRQHVLLLGPPGTAKSAMAEELCSRIRGRYFRWLLSRTTAPEELFGPISLKALEQDSYRRITTGKLPEANIVFLDEIFKCNSAVLNSLLTVLNERLFFNDGQPMQVPLEMAVGASNELPEDREELSALWDRFMLRYVVGYLKEEKAFIRMLEEASSAPPSKTTVSYDELKAAQREVEKVDVSPVLPTLAMLRRKMAEMNISVSDRRWKMALSAVKANAWLEGKTSADDEDLEILVHILWQDPEHRLQVRHEVMAIVNPAGQKLQDLMDQALEIYQNALKDAETDKAASKGTEAVAKLKKIAKELSSLEQELRSLGKGAAKVNAAMDTVKKYIVEVASRCLGIELA